MIANDTTTYIRDQNDTDIITTIARSPYVLQQQ